MKLSLKRLKKRVFPKKKKIFQYLIEHSEKSCEAVEQLELCVKQFCEGKLKAEDISKIDLLEDEADELEYAVSNKLFEGALLPFTGNDWFELLELVDALADNSERVGKLLIIYDQIKTSVRFKEELLKIVRYAVECSVIIKQGIKLLNEDMSKATVHVQGVGKKRHEARAIEYDLFSRLFKEDITYKEMVILKETIYWITQISNSAKKASNRIKMLAVKYSF